LIIKRQKFNLSKVTLFLLEKILRLFWPFLKTLEYATKHQYSNTQTSNNLPIFIIGLPRSGSTLLYQLITNYLDVLYINNLNCALNPIFFSSFKITNLLYKHKPHNCFHSEKGNTTQCGLNAPSECGKFWYKWLDKNKKYYEGKDLSEEKSEEIKADIYAVINKFNKSIIFKNLHIAQRIGLIKEIVPDAKFIYIKRDPLFIAQSIFKARKDLLIAPNDWWSVEPRNYHEIRFNSIHEMIAKQVYHLEQQIDYDLSMYFPNKHLIINYGDLCNDYSKIISEISKFTNLRYKNPISTTKPKIKNRQQIIINERDFQKLKIELENLYSSDIID